MYISKINLISDVFLKLNFNDIWIGRSKPPIIIKRFNTMQRLKIIKFITFHLIFCFNDFI